MKIYIIICWTILITPLFSQPETINIWPSKNGSTKKTVALLKFPAPERKNQSPVSAIVILPGGGYWRLMADKEGTVVADWLRENGMQTFVLKYTLNPVEALKDAQRAVSIVRANAPQWNIDEKRIGVIGFSAGGHLAANLITHAGDKVMQDNIDKISSMPDFWIGVYGAYAGRQVPSFKDQVDKNTPPTFLVHAKDDNRVPYQGSVNLHNTLKKLGVSSELHIYEKGGHGFALEQNRGDAVKQTVEDWSQALLVWLKKQEIL